MSQDKSAPVPPNNELDDKKTPGGVSLPDKVSSLHSIINEYKITHPKPSISSNTAKKMLTRDLTTYIYTLCNEVIGKDETEPYPGQPSQRNLRVGDRNTLRAEQRTRLKELLKDID